MTAQDIIENAYKKLRLRNPTADFLDDGLDALNALINSWNPNSWKRQREFSSLGSAVTLPKDYIMALQFNLAVVLSPNHNVKLSKIVIATAIESKNNVVNLNKRVREANLDTTLTRNFRFPN